jgi:hypothetical protein
MLSTVPSLSFFSPLSSFAFIHNNNNNLKPIKMKAVDTGLSYPSKNVKGQWVYVYDVHGTEQEIADYKNVKGANYRENDTTGKPLFWTVEYYGPQIDLVFTRTGNVVADTSNIRKANSLVNQMSFMKDALAERMLDDLGFGGRKRTTITPVNEQQDVNMDPFKP